MLLAMLMVRRAGRHPHVLGVLAAAAAALPLGWFALYGLVHKVGCSGAVVVLVAAVVAAGAVFRRRVMSAAAARARFYARFAPAVRPAVAAQCAGLHEAVAPFLAVGLPPLHADPVVYVTPGGGALLHVRLPRGLHPDHLAAAAPGLARYWGVPVTVTADPYDRRAVVLELHPPRVPAHC
jgi:hypothetical protein